MAQVASMMVFAYEAKMNEVQHTIEQSQLLIINERKSRLKIENQLSAAQDQIVRLKDVVNYWKVKMCN